MKSIYLYPGKLAVSVEPAEITTLLGSCVGIFLYDKTKKIGGLNHYLLPEPGIHEHPTPRYGSFAIETLINEMLAAGCKKQNIQAKVYGGASVLADVSVGSGIGKNNIAIAEKKLKEHDIDIVEKNVSGETGRKIIVNTETFEVRHLFLGKDEDGSEKQSVTNETVDVSGFSKLFVAKNVKVLVVDDSATVRNMFSNIFTRQGLTVVGTAADAYEARELIATHKPDVLTLDIEMPRMSGVAFLEKLMQHAPIPVVMVSSLGAQGEAAMKALELGAVEFVHKPTQFDPMILKNLGETLVEKVRAAASVNVVKRKKQIKENKTADSEKHQEAIEKTKQIATVEVITVGGNAGSQDSLVQFLSGLANDTPPVVIANSTISGFLEPFFAKMKGKTSVKLVEAKEGDYLRMGEVYFAPPEMQTRLTKTASGINIKLSKEGPVMGQTPSANILFQSAVNSVKGGVIGVLLGGFGADGVDGLAKIQAAGGVTIAQLPDTASFPHAPQKAIAMGIVDNILEPNHIAGAIMQYRNKRVA